MGDIVWRSRDYRNRKQYNGDFKLFFYTSEMGSTPGSSKCDVTFFLVCFLLGNSPASEFFMPTFRNTLFHLHRQVHLPAYEDGTECSETSAYKIPDAGELPRRKHTRVISKEMHTLVTLRK